MKSLVISLLLAILPISAVATEKNDSASVTMSKYDAASIVTGSIGRDSYPHR